jgi:threonine dehydratase
MISLEDIKTAASRLRGVAVHTPLVPYPRPQPGRELYLKPESFQPIGSFKLRGAYNKIASLTEDERRRGVISFSSGNHAQGVAYAARALGVKAIIVMPNNAPQIKIDSTRALGAEVVFVGPASSERQARAEQLAAQHGYVVIPPYNDEKIIAGAGTAGLEIFADLPDAGLVLVPVGGGGLISGIATALKLSGSPAKVIGVEPELAGDAQASFSAGHLIEFSAEQTSRTLADGLRTQSVGEINFEHIRRFVDDIVTVSESQILAAVRTLALDAKLVAEPSGAVTVAAFLYCSDHLPPSPKTVAVITGGNIDPALLARVVSDTSPHP